MKTLLALIAFLMSSNSFAKTKFSQTIAYVQKKYADQSKEYPILIFDKDEVHYRFAQAKAYGDLEDKELERQRATIITNYVKEKTGVEINGSDALNLETYLTKLKKGAFALPLRSGGFYSKTYKLCVVFPAMPNSNQRLESERVTGLQTAEAYKGIDFHNFGEKLTFEQMQLFSLYHELGHCLDPEFMPKSYEGYEVDPHQIHQSESFAETLGLFLLEREGIVGTARARANYRNLYTQKMGKWFVDNPQNSFGNEAYLYGGIIYYLVPVLHGAQAFINQNNLDVASLGLKELINHSIGIVNKHAIKSRSFRAYNLYFQKGEREAIKEYEEMVAKMPGYFEEALSDLKHFIKKSTSLLNEFLDFDVVTEEVADQTLSAIDYESSCVALKAERRGEIEVILEEARNELENSKADIKEQRLRQKELNSFYENLLEKCD